MTTSTGPFGSTCTTATCLRHPSSAKLSAISATVVLIAESVPIRFRRLDQRWFASLNMTVTAGILLDLRIANMRRKMRSKMRQVNTKVLIVLISSFASVAFSEDFKTVNGKEYKDATIIRVEPDGIVVKTKSGITKVYFAELSKEIQERFHYDQQKAGAYSATQAANYTAYQKQQQDAQRKRDDAAAKNNAILAEQEEAKNRTKAMRGRLALQSTSFEMTTDARLVSRFTTALGVRTRPRVAFDC